MLKYSIRKKFKNKNKFLKNKYKNIIVNGALKKTK